MRGVDLNRFDFDYDLTWMGFFMNGQGKILGRYGGRDARSADTYLSLPSLKQAMHAALAAYRRDPKGRPAESGRPLLTVEHYPAEREVKDQDCIHCHQVYDFRREALKAEGKWRKERIWVYPQPENVGVTLDRERQSHIRTVGPGSAAAAAGLKAGDTLRAVNGTMVASFGDVQYALHRAPASGKIPVSWQRNGRTMSGRLQLEPGWRKTDISWRASMWGLEPAPCVYGQDLTAEEKAKLGLPADRLAFRQGKPLPKPPRDAGLQPGDIILGIDDRPLTMTMLQFNTWIRLNFQVSDRITFNVIRNGQRLDLPMVLPAKASW